MKLFLFLFYLWLHHCSNRKYVQRTFKKSTLLCGEQTETNGVCDRGDVCAHLGQCALSYAGMPGKIFVPPV